MRSRAFTSSATDAAISAPATPSRMLPHGCAGTSRVGTGWAWPGRSDAVSRSPAGSAPSRSTMPFGTGRESELEVDEGTAFPLFRENRDGHDREDGADQPRRRALDRDLERLAAHPPVSPDDRRDDHHR